MKERLYSTYNFFSKKPLLLSSILGLTVLGLLAALSLVVFEEDISSFLPEKENNERINHAYKQMGSSNKIMVMISAKDSSNEERTSLLQRAADDFVETLSASDSTGLTQEFFYKADEEEITEIPRFIVQNMPYYLDENDYQRLDSILTTEGAILSILQNNVSMLYTPGGSMLKEIMVADPLFISGGALSKLRSVEATSGYHLKDGYIFDKAGETLMLTLISDRPSSETLKNKEWIELIDNTAQLIEQKYDGELSIESIGAAMISLENANQIKKDSLLSVVIAVVLILLLLFLFYRDFRSLLLISFSIGFGALFSLALLAVFKDSISIISVGVGSIIVGIAVNYPLHFLAHYKENGNVGQTIKEITAPLVIGNITTVGAFLSLLFISSDAMRDMGLFAALLLIGTILFVLLFLPHFIKDKLLTKSAKQKLFFGRLARMNLDEKPVLVVVLLLMTIPLFYFGAKTEFETDMHKINYMTDNQRVNLQKLISETENGLPKVYCISEGVSMEEALVQYESVSPLIDSLQKEGFIVKNSGISIFLPSKQLQEEKIAMWNEFWADRKRAFLSKLSQSQKSCGFQSDAFALFESTLQKKFEVQELDYFQPLIESFGRNYLLQSGEAPALFSILECAPDSADKVVEILDSYNTGVYAFDNKSFLVKMIENLSEDFNYVLFICAFIVFIFLTLSFGRVELSLMAIIPLSISWVWILGIMGIMDLRFNIVNIILATFIFGQGDDYTIFVTEGLMNEYTHRKKVLASYKNSILLSALIMFIGIGTLIVAKHPAMRSLAEVTIIGMAVVLLMAYLFPPLIFKWLTRTKKGYRLMPITLKNLLVTIFSFTVFIVGSIILTTIGFLLLTIGGKSEKNKLKFHTYLCNTFRLLVKAIPLVDCHLHNTTHEDFSKPGIIICNHQSHLDLMYTLMLNPKIICLTNKWVWNCPFYGNIIRFAEFYPVSEGLDDKCVNLLKGAIERGYSILIFPEGTRSEDCSILHFYQGAFHLANELKVDIIPVLLHGVGHVFPKKEFLLRKGRVDVKILPRIGADSPMRKDLGARNAAQLVRKYYAQEYAQMCQEIESVYYYKDLVYHNYIYKGAEIAKEAKKNLKKIDEYASFVSSLPDDGEYRMDNCGQGELALLSALVKKNLKIVATDRDAEKISIAKHCISVPPNLIFEVSEN